MNILELIRGVISVSLLGLSFLLVSATPIPSDAVVPQSESGPSLIPDVINISDAAMFSPWEAEPALHHLIARRGLSKSISKFWPPGKKTLSPAEEISQLLDELGKHLKEEQSPSSIASSRNDKQGRIVADLRRLSILIGRLQSPNSPPLTEEVKVQIGLRLVTGIAAAKINVVTWSQSSREDEAILYIKASENLLKDFSNPPSLGTEQTRKYLQSFRLGIEPQSLTGKLAHLVSLVSQMSLENKVSMQSTLDDEYGIFKSYVYQVAPRLGTMTEDDRAAASKELRKWEALNALAKNDTWSTNRTPVPSHH